MKIKVSELEVNDVIVTFWKKKRRVIDKKTCGDGRIELIIFEEENNKTVRCIFNSWQDIVIERC